MSAYQDGLYKAVDAAYRLACSRDMGGGQVAYRLLSSDRHWLLYASTETSERNEGAANNCTLMRPLVTVSSLPATARPAHASNTVVKGKARIEATTYSSHSRSLLAVAVAVVVVVVVVVDGVKLALQSAGEVGMTDGWERAERLLHCLTTLFPLSDVTTRTTSTCYHQKKEGHAWHHKRCLVACMTGSHSQQRPEHVVLA